MTNTTDLAAALLATQQEFEAAVRATDPRHLLATDFVRHEVSTGYAGYTNPQTEAAFFGWTLAKGGIKA